MKKVLFGLGVINPSRNCYVMGLLTDTFYKWKEDRFVSKFMRLFFVFLLLAFVACQRKDKSANVDSSIDVINLKDFEQNPISDEEFAQAYHFIPLETTDSCLVGNVLDVKMAWQKFFILDDKDKLWVFDKNGKSLGKIGSQGSGPEEYIRINQLYVNESKGYLGLLDMARNTVVRYTIENKFIDRIRFKFDLVCTSVSLINNGETVLLLSSNSKKEKYNYAAYNESDFSFISYEVPFRILGEERCSNQALTAHNSGTSSFALAMNSDTIYQWKENHLQLAYIIEGGLKHITAEALLQKTPHDFAPSVAYRLFREDGYSVGLESLYATDRYLLFNYSSTNTNLFLDRKQNQGRLFQPKKTTFLTEISTMASSTSDTSIIRCLSVELMDHVKEELKNANHPEYHKIYDKLQDDNNPVIALLDYEKLLNLSK